jgi:hypothetical protein
MISHRYGLCGGWSKLRSLVFPSIRDRPRSRTKFITRSRGERESGTRLIATYMAHIPSKQTS